jgi:hypothetical protein
MLKSLCLGVAVLFGVALGANGIFMLVAPENWYFAVPASGFVTSASTQALGVRRVDWSGF